MNYILTTIATFTLMLVLTPAFRQFALKIKLVDQPNARKVHYAPVPLVGGISVFVSTALVLMLQPQLITAVGTTGIVLMAGAFILLLTGVIDDFMDVRAAFKLVIQIAVAFFVFSAGIRIESLYGFLGIYELAYFWQGVLTILIITGVINAFNLTDGIDGLSASLILLALISFCILTILLGHPAFLVVFLALIGALLGFLRFNLSTQKKIFMGDAGALFLGFIIVVSGIALIQMAHNTAFITPTVSTVIGVLAFPVIDSLRVYRRRIRQGYSPFRADKTHFHHLVLNLGLKHKTATAFIVTIAVGILGLSIASGSIYSLTMTVVVLLTLFGTISSVLSLNQEVVIWREKLRHQENN